MEVTDKQMALDAIEDVEDLQEYKRSLEKRREVLFDKVMPGDHASGTRQVLAVGGGIALGALGLYMLMKYRNSNSNEEVTDVSESNVSEHEHLSKEQKIDGGKGKEKTQGTSETSPLESVQNGLETVAGLSLMASTGLRDLRKFFEYLD